MNRLKLFTAFLVLLTILNCSKISEKIDEKIQQRQREALEKIDSVIRSRNKDSISRDLEKELKAIDSIRTGSDSTMREIEKKMKQLQKKEITK